MVPHEPQAKGRLRGLSHNTHAGGNQRQPPVHIMVGDAVERFRSHTSGRVTD